MPAWLGSLVASLWLLLGVVLWLMFAAAARDPRGRWSRVVPWFLLVALWCELLAIGGILLTGAVGPDTYYAGPFAAVHARFPTAREHALGHVQGFVPRAVMCVRSAAWCSRWCAGGGGCGSRGVVGGVCGRSGSCTIRRASPACAPPFADRARDGTVCTHRERSRSMRMPRAVRRVVVHAPPGVASPSLGRAADAVGDAKQNRNRARNEPLDDERPATRRVSVARWRTGSASQTVGSLAGIGAGRSLSCFAGLLVSLIVSSACAGVTAQQQVVLPSSTLYGTSVPYNILSVPCTPGSATTTFQNLFLVEPHAGGVATAMAFRRRDFTSGPVTYPELIVDVEFGMSHTTRPVAIPSAFASRNRGSDYRVVVRRQTLRFPPSLLGAPPYPFDYRIAFDQPFVLQAGSTAMWELTRFGSSSCTTDPAPLGFDFAVWPADHSGSSNTPVGVECGGGSLSQNRLGVTFLTVGNFGEASIGRGGTLDTQSFAWLYWGLSADRWGGIALPLDLGPYGAPGCSVWISIDQVWPLEQQLVPLRHRTRVAVDVPGDLRLVGADIYFQGVRFNSGLNVARLATTNGVRARIGPHYPANGSGVMFWSGVDQFGDRTGGAAIFALTVF